MNPPPIPPLDENNGNSIPHQAAKASLIAVPLMFGLGIAGHVALKDASSQTQVILEMAACLLNVGGMMAAIVALAGIPSYGSRGLLGRGIAGLVLNGLLIFIFATNFSQARQKAEASRKAFQDFQASSADIRSDIRKSFDPKNGITNVDVDRMGRLSRQLKNASTNLSGDDARVARVMAGFIDRSQGALKNYQAAAAEMRDARVLERFDPEDKGQFASKREVVQRFLQANAGLMQNITNAEDIIRADLAKAQVSPRIAESVIAGYHSSAGPINGITLQIRQCDERLGNAALDALSTLETQWGHWKLDPAREKLVFDDAATREAYEKSILAMRDAANDQIQWQAKLVNYQSSLRQGRAQP